MAENTSAMALGPRDWAVALAYASGLIVLGLLVARRRLSAVDYFLASRASKWPVIGLAMLASLLLLVAVAWAPQLIRFPSLWQYLQAVLAYAVPPAVAIFGIGLFWRGATGDGATATLVAGSFCGCLLFLCNSVMGWTRFHFLYAAPLLTLLDSAILIWVSGLKPAATDAVRDATMWRRGRYRTQSARLAAAPVWQDYRYLAAVLLMLTTTVVVVFR